MTLTYTEAAYVNNDTTDGQCYLNATNAPYPWGQELDNQDKCGLSITVNIVNGTDYSQHCTHIFVISDVGDLARGLILSSGALVALLLVSMTF